MELRDYKESDFFYITENEVWADRDKIREAISYAGVCMNIGYFWKAMQVVTTIANGYKEYASRIKGFAHGEVAENGFIVPPGGSLAPNGYAINNKNDGGR